MSVVVTGAFITFESSMSSSDDSEIITPPPARITGLELRIKLEAFLSVGMSFFGGLVTR